MRRRVTFFGLLILALALPAGAQLLEQPAEESKDEPKAYYDRNEIPGHYTIGFYADEQGSSNELKIPKDATDFEVWIGVTGDSTRTFSGLAMSLDLPYGVDLGGAGIEPHRVPVDQQRTAAGHREASAQRP